MIVVLRPDATAENIEGIVALLKHSGLTPHLSKGEERTIIGVIGDKSKLDADHLQMMPGVDKLVPIVEPYKLANRQLHPKNTRFTIKDVCFGGEALVLMAGPCAVESYEQLKAAAVAVRRSGSRVLRGGAYKPRTSPYSFQGLGEAGFRLLRQVADEEGLLVISEVMSEMDLEEAARYVDIVQIGARNAQNFRLLKALGRSGLPVLLKRGIAETIEELLSSTEYILSEGNQRLILCERGIRTFETATRNTLDISAVPVLKEKTHLPVFVDPSHAAGKARYVPALALAAISAGADGLITEIHPRPAEALSDAAQQMELDDYLALCRKIEKLAPLFDRRFSTEADTKPGVERLVDQAGTER